MVQDTCEDVVRRKQSVVSVVTMREERLTMRINFFQWLAVRRWEMMARDDEREHKGKRWLNTRWKGLMGRKTR